MPIGCCLVPNSCFLLFVFWLLQGLAESSTERTKRNLNQAINKIQNTKKQPEAKISKDDEGVFQKTKQPDLVHGVPVCACEVCACAHVCVNLSLSCPQLIDSDCARSRKQNYCHERDLSIFQRNFRNAKGIN